MVLSSVSSIGAGCIIYIGIRCIFHICIRCHC